MDKEEILHHFQDINFYYNDCMMYDDLSRMLDELIAENKGEWIYDKSIYNWRCSECGETPPPTGYVGKAEFMATYFKFCNYCGADMRGET